MNPIKTVSGKLERLAAAHRSGYNAQRALQEHHVSLHFTEKDDFSDARAMMTVYAEGEQRSVSIEVDMDHDHFRLRRPYLFDNYGILERIKFGTGVRKAYREKVHTE